ncbi:PilT/PilU family type 4a pilus ATPase [Paenibacillus pasadenensis]|uniref:type IV pilus twitching motility protein PilT n=1 Tax=Paenibacillus pasadenensis TaxID=217090 RepID=UPI00203C7020|nr:PilT/PilU family type 4a pilus ATPase [Paenibacillus pasadenensis]MCM3750066.1 PilT/PilU family type 4a pilus ATPase [Paenibacillus pasadenensis]
MTQPLDKMLRLLHDTAAKGASDLHLSPGAPPMLRIDGWLEAADDVPLTGEECAELIVPLLGKMKERFEAEGEADLAWETGGQRFRLNIFRQQGGVSLAARPIHAVIPTPESLGLQPQLREWAERRQGLLLVTGPTGSGKSSTLAALIGHLNRTGSRHIVTLEDPIEFLHAHDRSIVDQREIGRDTLSFASGLRAALRQAPDVIMVGEMRDPDTIAAALTAAETGHLVLSTLHTADAPQTIDRIIDVFPAERQAQIRTQLASLLLAVHSQRLLRRAGGGGRVLAAEVLVNTPAVANLIRTEKGHQLRSIMQTGRQQGMTTLENSVRELLGTGAADAAEAMAYLKERGE